jgi:hypothetical protein
VCLSGNSPHLLVGRGRFCWAVLGRCREWAGYRISGFRGSVTGAMPGHERRCRHVLCVGVNGALRRLGWREQASALFAAGVRLGRALRGGGWVGAEVLVAGGRVVRRGAVRRCAGKLALAGCMVSWQDSSVALRPDPLPNPSPGGRGAKAMRCLGMVSWQVSSLALRLDPLPKAPLRYRRALSRGEGGLKRVRCLDMVSWQDVGLALWPDPRPKALPRYRRALSRGELISVVSSTSNQR